MTSLLGISLPPGYFLTVSQFSVIVLVLLPGESAPLTSALSQVHLG